MNAPRLLIVASVPSTLTNFLLPFADHYRKRGWWVGAAANGATSDSEVLGNFSNAFEVSWTRSPLDIINLSVAPRELRHIVKRNQVDLVHVHDPIAAFITRLALRGVRRRREVAVVYTAHGFHFFRGNSLPRNLAFRALESIAAPWTDRLVVINHEDLESANRLRVAGGTTYMPGIGLDLDHYNPAKVSDSDVAKARDELGLSVEAKVLLVVAELNSGKRHRDTVAALAASNRPEVTLVCAGVGPEEEAIKRLARELGVEDRVKLIGYRRDIPVLMKLSFAVALPSEREGLPRSLMEASALEVPVVATRIRGVTELVVHGVTGYLTEVGDVSAQAEAIRSLVDEPAAAKEMGCAGRDAMRPFDLNNVIRLHDELYASVLGDKFV